MSTDVIWTGSGVARGRAFHKGFVCELWLLRRLLSVCLSFFVGAFSFDSCPAMAIQEVNLLPGLAIWPSLDKCRWELLEVGGMEVKRG